MKQKISTTDCHIALKKLEGWKLVSGRSAITRTFEFQNFTAAFSWMTAIAMHAENLDHHPEWFNVYNKVIVTLSTHDVSGISILDIKLANIMNNTK